MVPKLKFTCANEIARTGLESSSTCQTILSYLKLFDNQFGLGSDRFAKYHKSITYIVEFYELIIVPSVLKYWYFAGFYTRNVWSVSWCTAVYDI